MRRWALALGLAWLAGLATGGPGEAAPPRPAEFPPPTLAVSVAPVPLGVERPRLEPPPPPPLATPTVELGAAPAPRVLSGAQKPLPAVRDPGGFPCAIVIFSRAEKLAECGVHRLLSGDYRGAREAFEESVAIDARGSQAPVVYVWLGELALMEATAPNSPAAARAERAYRAALPLALPAELAAHAELGLGILALRRGDVAEADAQITRALGRVPPQPVALVARFYLGTIRLLQGREADALALWDEVAQSGAPDAVLTELPFWRAVAYGRLGDADRALGLLDGFASAVPSTHPLRAEALVQAAWIALERGAGDEAVRRFLEADRMGPRAELRPAIWAGLVRAHLARGDTVQATSAARRLSVESPRDPLVGPALLLIAEAATRRGAVGEAIFVYRQLLPLPLSPGLPDYVRYRLGETLEQDGRTPEAKDHYRQLRDQGKDEGIAQRASYRLGLLALRDNDAGAARREGEALLRAGTLPELREGALFLIAESALRGGDPNRAVTVLRTALREAPAGARAGRARLALGWAHHQDGDGETALREWRAVAAGADLETRGLALLAIADVTLRQGRETEALVALRAMGPAPGGEPPFETAVLDRGILAVRTRDYAEAADVLEPLTSRTRDVARQALLRRALGIARYHLGQYDQAERQFRQSAQLVPQELSSWLGTGLAALAHGRLAEAEDALARSRFAAADVAESADYGLVLAAIQRRDDDGFRERATRFVDRFPTQPVTPILLYGLVVKAIERGNLDDARGVTQRLLRGHASSDYGTDALLRLVAASSGRPDVARQAYRDLLARATPSDARADAWLGLAEVALAAGDGAEAQRAAEGFVREADPRDLRAARALTLLVRADQTQGQVDRALRDAEEFLRRFPEDREAPAMQLVRGQILIDARRWPAAQQAFEAARDRGDVAVAAPAQFWLGETLRARGDHEAALAAYLAATYLYPDSPWAARGLQGAAQSYVARQMPREAGIVLRKLSVQPGIDPALLTWAREALARLGPAAAAPVAPVVPAPTAAAPAPARPVPPPPRP